MRGISVISLDEDDARLAARSILFALHDEVSPFVTDKQRAHAQEVHTYLTGAANASENLRNAALGKTSLSGKPLSEGQG
jgi:hypothetical protein